MKAIKFNLENIKLLRSEVRDHPKVYEQDFNLEQIQIDTETKFNYYDDYIQNFLHFKFELNDQKKTIVLGHFDIIFTFEVNDLKTIINKSDTKEILLLNILSIAYSTSRGILFSETKGFALNEVYLNLIAPKKLCESFLRE